MRRVDEGDGARLDVSELRQAIRDQSAQIERYAAAVDSTQEFNPDLWSLLTDMGISSLPFDPAYGGLGGSFANFSSVIEEVAYHGAGAALYCGPTVQVASAIMEHGSAEQKEQWATPLIRDGRMAAWSFTEPATGSDPKSIATTARRDGTDWVLSGGKMFTSFAAYADVALVYARTVPGRLGAFLVDTSDPGWQPGKPIKMMAFGGQGTAPVAIDDIRVPAESLLGDEDKGFDILIGTEAEGKVRASAMCCGIGRRALHEAVRYASERTHRDVPIGEKFPTIEALIGKMSAKVDAARLLSRRAALAVDADEGSTALLAASARIVCSSMAREVASDAMQVCGAYGFTQEMVVERLYREAKMYEVGQGVIELQHIIVGKSRLAEFAATGRLSDTVQP